MVTVKRKLAAAAMGAMLICGASGVARAGDDPPFISFYGGVYDVNDNETAGQFNIEYRSNWDKFYVKPFAGVMATTDAAYYGYGGFLLDVYFGHRIVFTPNVAVGLYEKGNGKDLGSAIEFRSGVELAYRFDNRMRLGFAFHHISNAHITAKNPGTELATVVLSMPLGSLFGD